MANRPGGELAARPLHFFFITDCSGSMAADGKIQALNNAVREALPHMRRVADENPNAQVLLRALKFSNGAQWHVSQPTPVNDFEWNDLSADGQTDMGRALSVLANELKMPPMSERALPPVLVLISDGQPTDDFSSGLKNLLEEPWGRKAVRVAIAIGEDANLKVLQDFIDNPEIRPLEANNPEALLYYIRWASTVVLQKASEPANPAGLIAGGVVPIPLPAHKSDPTNDVW
ncbi:MAG: tellurium resistance protein [Acidobacteriota bacterium]|nr:tellurium resistance protein [Acidobacteriota bacterium]